MPFDRSPMRAIAMTRFQELFADLIGVRAVVGDFERLTIEHAFEHTFFFDEPQQRAWYQRTRAAYHFLDRGSLETPQGVAQHFLNCGELMGAAINGAIDSKREAAEPIGREDSAIRRKLAYYKDLVEGPYRVMLAPIAYAFARVMRNPEPDFIPGDDGKAKLRVLPRIERLSVYPQSQLAQGVNTHVRNAYAHSNFSVVDWEHVELWDPAPHKKGVMWGPEVWHVDSLDKLAENLELTNLAFMLALAIYSMNNQTLMQARGWARRTIARRKLTARDLKATLRILSSELGFETKLFSSDGAIVRIQLSTRHRGIDQVEQILMGGERRGRTFNIKVEFTDVPVIEQLLGLFQKTARDWSGYERVEIEVFDPEDKLLGRVEATTSIISRLVEGPSTLSVADARKLLSLDTLGDATLSYRHAHPPEPAPPR